MLPVSNPAAKISAEMSAADSSADLVLLDAKLSPRWLTWRFWTCAASCLHLCPILGPLYLLCGRSCREEEASSFRLTLTNHALQFQQMQYSCGCCCRSIATKSIPLDKIQDVMLKGDCCGDCCGCSEGNLKPYQLHIQTAGSAGGENSAAELSVYCACRGLQRTRCPTCLTPLFFCLPSPYLLQVWRTWRAFAQQ